MQETRTDICRLVWLFESCLQSSCWYATSVYRNCNLCECCCDVVMKYRSNIGLLLPEASCADCQYLKQKWYARLMLGVVLCIPGIALMLGVVLCIPGIALMLGVVLCIPGIAHSLLHLHVCIQPCSLGFQLYKKGNEALSLHVRTV